MSADEAPKAIHDMPNVLQRVFSTTVRVKSPSGVCKSGQEHHQCYWDVTRLNDHFTAVHAILYPSSPHFSGEHVPNASLQQANPSGHLAWAINKSQRSEPPAFTFLVPSSGYATRDDYLQLRLQGCPGIVALTSGLSSLARFDSPLCQSSDKTVIIDSGEALLQLAEQAAAALQWSGPPGEVSESERRAYLAGITQELRSRLNVRWLCPGPILRKRVALVRGRPNLMTGGPVYRAAASLGVDLVIIDEEKHWLCPDTDENKKYREAFLSTDMTEDAGVVDRIMASLRSYPLPIHGIFTLSDNFFVAVARVATELGLPTCPVSALEISVDKYKSRLLQNSPGHTARVNSADEMLALMEQTQPTAVDAFSPSFPMIVKPTKGWSSECVSKVNSAADLVVAVQKATDRHGGSAIVEPFFDGPEIDVNFVLVDGEIIFSEVADEQPSDADARNATVDDTFSAEGLTLPSALPAAEQDTARSTLHKILVDAGFRTGVFHVEARMLDSRCEYARLDSGIVDLVSRPAGGMPRREPSCRLIEINARPPAYRVSLSTRHTYGVDLFAAHILASIGDRERFALVTVPFDFGPAVSGRTQSSQCWSRLIYLPAPAEGIVKSEAPCEDLMRRRPDLVKHLVFSNDYCKRGDRVTLFSNGARTCVGHVLVRSGSSRREAIEIGYQLRRQFAFEVEDEARPDDA